MRVRRNLSAVPGRRSLAWGRVALIMELGLRRLLRRSMNYRRTLKFMSDTDADLNRLKDDVAALKAERTGVLARAKDAALIVGLVGGLVALADGGFKLYDRLTPADLRVETTSGAPLIFQLDSAKTRLTIETSVLLRNVGGKEDFYSNISGAMWPVSAGEDSALYFTDVAIRRSGSADTLSLPLSVSPRESATYRIDLSGDFGQEQGVILTGQGEFRLRITFSTNHPSRQEAVYCVYFGATMEQALAKIRRVTIQPSLPCGRA